MFLIFTGTLNGLAMRYTAIILYLLIWAIYIRFSYCMFPVIGDNATIPVIAVVGLGAWLFGRTGGLLILLPVLMYQALLTSFLYGDLVGTPEHKIAGSIVIISITLLIGTLKEHYTVITRTSRQLDRMVESRNRELHQLTAELLNNTETQRVCRGQELHDGMGQHLTGIQLLCSSLLTQLKEEQHSAFALTQQLETQARSIHNHIRRLARMLFPIRISMVGITAALSELAASIEEIRPVHFSVDLQDAPQEMEETLALQIYRICQETALHLIENTDADEISLRFYSREEDYRIDITYNGKEKTEPECESIIQLILYRLNQLSGTFSAQVADENRSCLSFNIPHTATAVS